MPQEAHHRWPMPEYLSAWKLFRDLSDENEVTAEFLLKRPSWPKEAGVEICDLGCGDGKLMTNILTRSDNIQKLRLVDPEDSLLTEAKKIIGEQFPKISLLSFLESVHDGWPTCAGDSTVILAAHLIYLLEKEELLSLIHNRPKNATSYIIFDAPGSVFSDLWQWTAEKFYNRVKLTHTELCNHLGLVKPPCEKLIRSRFPKYLLTNHKLSDWLLSILCYRNMLSDVPPALRKNVMDIIDKHTDKTGEFVECESVCYELPRQL
ncbi:MAG: hypothetical protein ACH346_02495 [Chthoniobacterales bacterium]